MKKFMEKFREAVRKYEELLAYAQGEFIVPYPLTCSWKENEGGTLAPEYSLVSSDQDNAVIEVVKKAEDSDAVIVRLYECYNRRTPVTLIFGKELTSVVECNMMEEGADPVEFTGNQATFEMKPYEIKTLKVTF